MTDHPATDGTTEQDAAWERFSSVVENNGSHGSIKNAARELIRAALSAQQSAERELRELRSRCRTLREELAHPAPAEVMRVVEAARAFLSITDRIGHRDVGAGGEYYAARFALFSALDAATEGEKTSTTPWGGVEAEPRGFEPAPPQTEGGESAEARPVMSSEAFAAIENWKLYDKTRTERDELRAQLAEAEQREVELKKEVDTRTAQLKRRQDDATKYAERNDFLRRELASI